MHTNELEIGDVLVGRIEGDSYEQRHWHVVATSDDQTITIVTEGEAGSVTLTDDEIAASYAFLPVDGVFLPVDGEPVRLTTSDTDDDPHGDHAAELTVCALDILQGVTTPWMVLGRLAATHPEALIQAIHETGQG